MKAREHMSKTESSDEMSLTRVEALSDGLFSIALTLLVLDIKVPHLADAENATALVRALLNQWPVYLSYAIAFLTLGSVWIAHHQMLKFVARTTRTLQVLNIVFLMFVTITPFTTSLLAEYLQQPNKLGIAAFVYGLGWVLQGVSQLVLWFYLRKQHLLRHSLTAAKIASATRTYMTGTMFGAVATALALLVPIVSVVIYGLVALLYVLPLANIFESKEEKRK